jgi:hypothetical protein
MPDHRGDSVRSPMMSSRSACLGLMVWPYCVTLESSGEAWNTLQTTEWVEGRRD